MTPRLAAARRLRGARLALLALALSLLAPAARAEAPEKPADVEAAVAAHLDRGASLLYQGKYDEAIAELEAALELRPTYLKARLNLATAYFHKKDYPRSERELLRCLKLDPAYTNARFNLAITYHAAGKYDEALAAYRKVLEEDPKRAAAWKNIGRIHERQGDLLRAAADYERSLAIDPDQAGSADLRRQAEGLRLRQAAAAREGAAPSGQPEAAAPGAAAAAAPEETPSASAPAPEVATSRPSPAPPPAEPPAATPVAPPPAPTPTPAPAPSSTPADEPAPEAPEVAKSDVEAATPPIEELQPSARRKAAESSGSAPAEATPAPPSDPQILQSVLASLVKTVSPGATLLVSAPLGIEVYLRKADIREKDPFDEYGPFRANKRTRDLLKLRADITDRKLFRGYTPMTVTLEEGHYQIAFRKPGDVKSWHPDGELEVQSANISIRQGDLPSDLKIYELTVTRHDPPFLVSSLFQERSQDARAFGAAACSGSAFTVDEARLRSALGSYALDPARVDAAIGVLACAGKAIVDDEQGPLVITLTARGNFQITRGRADAPASATAAR